MAVLEPLRVELADFTEQRVIDYPLHPADPTHGTAKITFSNILYIERTAFRDGPADAGWASLAADQPIALRYGPVLYVKEVLRKGKEVCGLVCTHTWDIETKSQLMAERKRQKKVLLHIHWVSETDRTPASVNLYEPLFLSRDPMQVEDWVGDMNPNSLVKCSNAILPGFAAAYSDNKQPYKVFQFERLGFFVVDELSTAEKPVWNRVVPLKVGHE